MGILWQLGETIPQTLLKCYNCIWFISHKIMLIIVIKITQIKGQQLLFPGSHHEPPRCNEYLLPAEIRYKVRYRIQLTHYDIQGDIIENVDIPTPRINLSKMEGSMNMRIADHIRIDDQCPTPFHIQAESRRGVLCYDNSMDYCVFRRRQP